MAALIPEIAPVTREDCIFEGRSEFCADCQDQELKYIGGPRGCHVACSEWLVRCEVLLDGHTRKPGENQTDATKVRIVSTSISAPKSEAKMQHNRIQLFAHSGCTSKGSPIMESQSRGLLIFLHTWVYSA